MSEQSDKILRLLEAQEDQIDVLKRLLASRDDTVELYQERLKVALLRVEGLLTENRILNNQLRRKL